MPAGQDGIQKLLQAEQEAQAIVTRARQGAVCFLKLQNRCMHENCRGGVWVYSCSMVVCVRDQYCMVL